MLPLDEIIDVLESCLDISEKHATRIRLLALWNYMLTFVLISVFFYFLHVGV